MIVPYSLDTYLKVSFIIILVPFTQIPPTKFLVHVLKVITVHALVQAATWNVVAFLVMRLWICRVSIDAMVCFCALITSIHPSSSYGFIDADINECTQSQSLCHNGACVNTDGSFLYLCTVGYILNPEEQSCIGKLILDNHTWMLCLM